MLVPSQTFGLVLGGAQLSRCLLPGMKLPLQVSQSVHSYFFVLIQIFLPLPHCVEEAECERLVVGCYRLILFLCCRRSTQIPQTRTPAKHSTQFRSVVTHLLSGCTATVALHLNWGAELWWLLS